jgi:hypothetical protein
VIGSAPERQGLELAFRDYDRQLWIAQEWLGNSRREIEHVGSPRRAEVFLLYLDAPAPSYSRSGWSRRSR